MVRVILRKRMAVSKAYSSSVDDFTPFKTAIRVLQAFIRDHPVESWFVSVRLDAADFNVMDKYLPQDSQDRMTTMPVGPLTTSATITRIAPCVVADSVLGSCPGYQILGNYDLHPIGRGILNSPDALESTARGFSLSFSSLRKQEFRRQQYKYLSAPMKEILSAFDSRCYEVRAIFFEWQMGVIRQAAERAMRWAHVDEIRRYAVKHADSTMLVYEDPLTGRRTPVKWRHLIDYKPDGLVDEPLTNDHMHIFGLILAGVLFSVLEVYSKQKDYTHSGYILVLQTLLLSFGIRQRTGDFLKLEKGNAEEKVHRSRGVVIIPFLNCIFSVFTKIEVHELENGLFARIQIVAGFKIDGPIQSGGKVYAHLADALNNGNGWFGDGVNWDTKVAILTKVIGAAWLGWPSLPSGISFTSIAGIVAMVILLMVMQNLKGVTIDKIFSFGDDVVVIGKMVDFKGYIESDEVSQRYQIYLGYSMNLKRVLAFKLFKDSASLMRGEVVASYPAWYGQNTVQPVTYNHFVTLPERISMLVAYGVNDIVDPLTFISHVGESFTGSKSWYDTALEHLPSTSWWSELLEYDKKVGPVLWNMKYTRDTPEKDKMEFEPSEETWTQPN